MCANPRLFLFLKVLQLCRVQSLCRRCTIPSASVTNEHVYNRHSWILCICIELCDWICIRSVQLRDCCPVVVVQPAFVA